MSFQIDHIVVLVNDLAAATAQYTTRGFTVVPGGAHTDGATHNALIALADSSYIELIAFTRAAPEHRWWQHTQYGEGPIDWALLPSDIARDIATAQQRGVGYRGPIAGGRLRPDGQELRWQTGLAPSADLPFLCADVTPRTLRVPQGKSQQHANGAQGIARITVTVRDMEASTGHYRSLLDTASNPSSLRIGTTRLMLKSGERDGISGVTLRSEAGELSLA